MASTTFSLIAIVALCTTVSALADIRMFDSTVDIPEECYAILGNDEIAEDVRNYCNIKPKNYPQDILDEHLKTMDFPTHLEQAYVGEEDCGDGVESEKEKNCCTLTRWETPFIVKSESNLKLVIQSKFFQQKIKTVTCADQGQKCFKDFDLETWGYKTECQPNWSFSHLYVYNSETKEVEWVPFNFPVSCSCSIMSV